MRKALVLTIGTEITAGEVVNTNASWISIQLEDLGLRVFAHLTVRDHRDEILRALAGSNKYDLVIVTGGLGPTTDDITRECMATYTGQALAFDEQVWNTLAELYQQRGLPLRQAHRHQCHFPLDSQHLLNPVGTALGFHQVFEGRPYFVLPGPPRELEGMWKAEVLPKLRSWLPKSKLAWVRWTCLGAPESEIAELVEPVLAGKDIEVGYRAQVPYVKVKVYVDPVAQRELIGNLERALAPYIVARGQEDLADEFLKRWPGSELFVFDQACGIALIQRLMTANHSHLRLVVSNQAGPKQALGLHLSLEEKNFVIELVTPNGVMNQSRSLPFKIPLTSERGQRSIAEWALWDGVRYLRSLQSP